MNKIFFTVLLSLTLFLPSFADDTTYVDGSFRLAKIVNGNAWFSLDEGASDSGYIQLLQAGSKSVYVTDWIKSAHPSSYKMEKRGERFFISIPSMFIKNMNRMDVRLFIKTLPVQTEEQIHPKKGMER